jgi:hypothetical protein
MESISFFPDSIVTAVDAPIISKVLFLPALFFHEKLLGPFAEA